MEPTTADVAAIVRTLDSGNLSRTEEDACLKILEAYQCWTPFLRVVQRRIQHTDQRQVADYICLARIQRAHLGQLDDAAATAAQLVRDLRIDYRLFREAAIPQLFAEDDYAIEAPILDAISQLLPDKESRVSCMERLCLIYEKKKYNEKRLEDSYRQLFALDPENLKALRFFKVVYTQGNEWEEVAKTLRTLLGSVKHSGDRFRYAQELATVYLYQLDRPKKSLEIIDKYCSKSHLDTSIVHFEAFSRLGNWEGCLRVLKECLAKVDAASSKAVLHYRIAELEAQLGRPAEAEAGYHASLQFNPQFLEAWEGLIQNSLAKRDWLSVSELLGKMANVIRATELKLRIEEARTRLLDGIASAG